jgi:Stability determinant
VAEAAAIDRPASQIVREFMGDFVRSRQEEREHDGWFRAEVEKALKDKRPGIAHDEVEGQFRKAACRCCAQGRVESAPSTVRSGNERP